MIDHISVGVSELERSAKFYEATLAALGLTRLVTRPRTVGFGKAYPEFWINLREGMPRCRRRRAACTSACGRRRRPRSMHSTLPRLRPAAHPMARRASARTIACATTQPSSSIPMATGSRR